MADLDIPSYYGIEQECDSNNHNIRPDNKDSCNHTRFRQLPASTKLCTYPLQVGADVAACGYPHMRWVGWDLTHPRKALPKSAVVDVAAGGVKTVDGKPWLQRTLNKSSQYPWRQLELSARQSGQQRKNEHYTTDAEKIRWQHLAFDEREYYAPNIPSDQFTPELLQEWRSKGRPLKWSDAAKAYVPQVHAFACLLVHVCCRDSRC